MDGGRIRPGDRFGRLAGSCLLAAALSVAGVAASQSPAALAQVPHLDHAFVIMEENNGFHDVIGNPAAPNLNYLARTFGLEADYFGVSPDSSESNYVGLLGGSVHGITSDDAYWKNLVHAPSLISQLDQARVSWKAYLQALPYPGYQGICYPAKCNGAPDIDPLYVSKHDAIQNYTTSLNSADWSRQVPIGALAADLRSGHLPRFGYVVPDECHDMHGDPPYCLDSGNIGDPQNQHLVAVGDAYLGHLVSEITHASFWSKGNNAVVVTYDNGDNSAGCCDANVGGGQVATIVITSHGPRGATDATPANHYSLLSTLQHLFGLGCLEFTCDTKNVKPLPALFAVTGSKAIATRVLAERTWPTPTPSAPAEPTSSTKLTPSAGGWTVRKAQLLGASDNSLGAIAGSSPTDIWAVGNFLPDAAKSNQDATLTFAEHYNGTQWTVVRTPDAGPNFDTLFGVAASQGKAWAVGVRQDSGYADRALIETWNGKKWSIAGNPQPGSVRDMLSGASALSPADVWAVGSQEGGNGLLETLAEHWNGHSWTVVPTPDPGPSGNQLYAVDAVGPGDVWAAGQQLGRHAPDQGLVEHWDGKSWSVVPLPASASASVLLDGIAATPDGQAYVAGEADSPAGGGRPLIEYYTGGTWQTASVPASAGSIWTSLWGIATAADVSSRGGLGGSSHRASTAWAVGSYVDPKTDNNDALILHGTGAFWTVDAGPEPGSGSRILGAVTAVGGQLWAAGTYDDGGSRLPLIEHR
jgi:Phosphoesterase family